MQGISNGGDADASEVEDDPASASDDEEVSETEGSDFEDEVAVTKSRSNKPLTSECSLVTILPPFKPSFLSHVLHCCRVRFDA